MDTKDYRLFSEAYASIYTENQIEPEGEVISEMPEMKHVRTASDGQKRYSTKDDGRHQRGVSPDGKPGGVNVAKTTGPVGAAIHNTVRKVKNKIFGEDVDLFELIKDFLTSEGYANDEKSALAIMSNMSEEWRNDIIESIENDPSVVEQKATATDGHGNTYRDYSNDGLSDRQKRMKEFGAKRAGMLVKGV